MLTKSNGAGVPPVERFTHSAVSLNRSDCARIATISRRRKSSPFDDERDNNELNKNQRFIRGKLSLWECGWLDLRELAFYEYILLKRGKQKYARVDMVTLEAMFGCANTVRKIIRRLEFKIPELFQQFQDEGKSRKSYYACRYEDIPPCVLADLAVYGATVEARRQKKLAKKLADTERRIKAGRVQTVNPYGRIA